MSMKQPPRVWVSNENPQAGDILRVRAQIEHPMETGLRTDPGTAQMVRPRSSATRTVIIDPPATWLSTTTQISPSAAKRAMQWKRQS